jgi:hypothetical protein
MKKFLSLLLVAVLILALIPAINVAPKVTAATTGNVDVDVLVDRGVIQGYPDGLLHLERTITRAEFAKMIVKAFPYDYTPIFVNSVIIHS